MRPNVDSGTSSGSSGLPRAGAVRGAIGPAPAPEPAETRSLLPPPSGASRYRGQGAEPPRIYAFSGAVGAVKGLSRKGCVAGAA